MTTNPLKQYFTQTGMFVSLPSTGRFYSKKIKTSADGEIEIFPMNALDELQFQNPDGLLNNESLLKVIKRTVPGIEDPGEIPKPDFDVLLMALRMVTYGNTMETTVKCSECGHEDKREIDLTNILSTARTIPDDDSIVINDLVVHIKPYSLMSQSRLNEYMMEIQRTARQLQANSKGEFKEDELLEQLKNDMGKSVNDSAIELFNIASNSIDYIELPDGTKVIDKEFISAWLHDIKAPTYKLIRDKISYLSEEVISRKIDYNCGKCEAANTMEVNFDPANFFVAN